VYHFQVLLMPSPDTPSAIVEFTAAGPVRAVAAAIEAYASERRVVSALVVPWESDAVTVRMAVTSMKSDGWAIEHTNLGTVALVDVGDDLIRISVVPADAPPGDTPAPAEIRRKQTATLTAFAQQIEKKFGAPSSTSVDRQA
jgi:hypothetical protein